MAKKTKQNSDNNIMLVRVQAQGNRSSYIVLTEVRGNLVRPIKITNTHALLLRNSTSGTLSSRNTHHVPKDTCKRLFTAALYTIAKDLPKRQVLVRRVENLHKMDCHVTAKKDEIGSFSGCGIVSNECYEVRV